MQTARITQHADPLADPAAPVSTITETLDRTPETALITVWVMGDDTQRQRITDYLKIWQHIKPTTTGHTLQQKNLPPGPEYGIILKRLRAARLDGVVTDDAEERDLLEKLIEDLYRDRA